MLLNACYFKQHSLGSILAACGGLYRVRGYSPASNGSRKSFDPPNPMVHNRLCKALPPDMMADIRAPFLRRVISDRGVVMKVWLMRVTASVVLAIFAAGVAWGQAAPSIPVRGLYLMAPGPDEVPMTIAFIREALPKGRCSTPFAPCSSERGRVVRFERRM